MEPDAQWDTRPIADALSQDTKPAGHMPMNVSRLCGIFRFLEQFLHLWHTVPFLGTAARKERLWELRKDKGLNLEELAQLMHISKFALASYESNEYKEINHGSLITLADFYGVSIDYLLCRTENREQVNTPLTELHLNDEMVALLKSGRINNRLLCELAAHKDFIKFLVDIDIEVYVDGIASMQIQKSINIVAIFLRRYFSNTIKSAIPRILWPARPPDLVVQKDIFCHDTVV